MDYAALLRTLASDGGFTISAATGAEVKSGYAVALRGFEVRLDFMPDMDILRTYLRHVNASIARDDLPDGATLAYGAWRDERTGAYYLDAVAVLPDSAAAAALGLRGQQIAVYDLSEHKEIRLAA